MNFISGVLTPSQPVALNGFAQTILNSTKGHGAVNIGMIRRPPQPFINHTALGCIYVTIS